MKHVVLRTHEVQNIIAGRQTRLSRPVKLKISYEANREGRTDLDAFGVHDKNGNLIEIEESVPATLKDGFCPFGKVGDIIACKEIWFPTRYDFKELLQIGLNDCIKFKADGTYCPRRDCVGRSWKPSITMPLSACRLFLRVKEIRCERIQDITEEGAKAEGAPYKNFDHTRDGENYDGSHIEGYRTLHQSIYGPDSWDHNLWHWILIFEKTDKPE